MTERALSHTNATTLPIWAGLLSAKSSISGQFFNTTAPAPLEYSGNSLQIIICLVLAFSLIIYANDKAGYNDGIPILNRTFALEPRIFARFRWAFNTKKLLEHGNALYPNRPYRVSKGYTDVLVLPDSWIYELNKLPQNCLSSRKSHAAMLNGWLNGMNVVNETSHHVKMLLARVTPALPTLLPAVSRRAQSAIDDNLPKKNEDWKAVSLVEEMVLCFSQASAITLFGPPICDTPELVRLSCDFTKNIFAIAFTMRFVPHFLQHFLVWLTPFKWTLRKNWKQLEQFVMPEARNRKEVPGIVKETNLLSCMIDEAASEEESDPWMLTRLVGTVIAGGTYSSAAFVSGVILDLANNPDALAEIREEIRETNDRIKGQWTLEAFNSLDKLDSAMKETSRLSPGSLITYNRYVERDCSLPNGTQLKKGQFITTNCHTIAHDPTIFPDPEKYDALRYYKENLQKHRAQPFRSLEGEDHRWGAGRWACPGRFIASIISKIIIVKLLDGFDFQLVDGKRPLMSVLHEFVFMKPGTKVFMKRKDDTLEI